MSIDIGKYGSTRVAQRARASFKATVSLDRVENIKMRRFRKRIRSVVVGRHAPSSTRIASGKSDKPLGGPDYVAREHGKRSHRPRLLWPLKRVWQNVTNKGRSEQQKNKELPQDAQGPYKTLVTKDISSLIPKVDQGQIPRKLLPITEPVCISNANQSIARGSSTTTKSNKRLSTIPEVDEQEVPPFLGVTEPVRLPKSPDASPHLPLRSPHPDVNTPFPSPDLNTTAAVGTVSATVRCRSLVISELPLLQSPHLGAFAREVRSLPNRRFATEHHEQTLGEAMDSMFATASTPSGYRRSQAECNCLEAVFAPKRQRRASIPKDWRHPSPRADLFSLSPLRMLSVATLPLPRSLARSDSATPPFKTEPRRIPGAWINETDFEAAAVQEEHEQSTRDNAENVNPVKVPVPRGHTSVAQVIETSVITKANDRQSILSGKEIWFDASDFARGTQPSGDKVV